LSPTNAALDRMRRLAKRLLCALIGHVDRNHADEDQHYAYCIRCRKIFGHPWASDKTNKEAFDKCVAVMKAMQDDLRTKLNDSLNLHNRNLQDIAGASLVDRGHHCDSRKVLDSIRQRSWIAIKIKP
jgi:hypothetical protein